MGYNSAADIMGLSSFV